MRPTAWKLAAWAGATLVLVGVFLLYAQPQMMVVLGDMLWACFQ